jgi:hypothetical protein
LSGSLEVSVRQKTSADLELLIGVLEANKVLFTNEDSSKPENAAAEASSKLGMPSKKKSLNGKHAAFEKSDDSEAEILTLT